MCSKTTTSAMRAAVSSRVQGRGGVEPREQMLDASQVCRRGGQETLDAGDGFETATVVQGFQVAQVRSKWCSDRRWIANPKA
jgi:hypothetical protein